MTAIKDLPPEILAEQIMAALDGRTKRWLSFEVRIAEQELSHKMKGSKPWKDGELESIEDRLDFKFKDTSATV